MCAVGRPRQAPVAEWYTRQVEGLCPKGRGGSSPLGGTRHTGHVRLCRNEAVATATGSVAVARFCARAASSVGRASRLHREGQGFESLAAHHLFSLPLPLFPLLTHSPRMSLVECEGRPSRRPLPVGERWQVVQCRSGGWRL